MSVHLCSDLVIVGGEDQRESGGERRNTPSAAKTHLQWETDVSTLFFCGNIYYFVDLNHLLTVWCFPDFSDRNDEKTAADYKIQGGSVLHLVLALRGGGILLKNERMASASAL